MFEIVVSISNVANKQPYCTDNYLIKIAWIMELDLTEINLNYHFDKSLQNIYNRYGLTNFLQFKY